MSKLDDAVHEVVFYMIVTVILGSIFYLPWVLSSYALIPENTFLNIICITLGGITPMIGAIFTVRRYYGENSSFLFDAFKRKFNPYMIMITLFVPLMIFTGAIGLGNLLGQSYDVTLINWGLLVPVLISSVIVNVWEEIGWRGFALPRLQDKYSAILASIIVGMMWGIWHWPHLLVKNSIMLENSGTVWLFVLGTVLESIIITWLYNSSNGNLIVPTLYHAMVNAAGLTTIIDTGFILDPLLIPIVSMIVVVVLVIVFKPDNLSTKHRVGVQHLLE